jgi:hypothetical protein
MPAFKKKRAADASFSMNHKLGIHVVRYLPYDYQGRCNDFFGVEGWEGAEELGGAVTVSVSIRTTR